MNISGKTKICLSIGDPIIHSLSPIMHNAGYKALGIDDQYAYISALVKDDDIKYSVLGMRAFHFRGMSCTTPHKQSVMEFLDTIDPIAQKIGAVNTVVNDEGKLTGYNTDWIGVITALQKITEIKGKKVAIIGAGGAARAMVYGLVANGAEVTIYNRTLEKAEQIAHDFSCKAELLNKLNHIGKANIIINATTVGMTPNEANSPVPEEYLRNEHIILDAVYFPKETLLLRQAKEKGATIISGLEMLLYQGAAQFELYTGHRAPVDVMREALMQSI